MPKGSLRERIENYYARRESEWGYRYLLATNKHYGYFPQGVRTGLRKALNLMNHEVGKELGLSEGAKVLDAGCGEGALSIYLANNFRYKMSAVDVLKVNITRAVSKKDSEQVDFQVSDYSDMPYSDKTFDGVCIIEALVHSPDVERTLKEVHRVLKPGGILVTHNYFIQNDLPTTEEHTFKVIYDGSGMTTLQQFRWSDLLNIWPSAGFINTSTYNGIKEITPMMRRLYWLALVPYIILKILNKEEKFVNTYAGYWVYKLRHRVVYQMLRTYKPT